MSDFKDYDSGALGYDRQRSVFGVEQILDRIVNLTDKDKSEVHVLDAGCGTGNYSLALLEAGIGKVSLFDASNGMLDLARNKVDKYQREGKIGGIKQCVLPTIPFEDETFDVVMINMVLHHLKADNEDSKNKVISSVFGEAVRVLKHAGVLLITTCFPEQYYGYWYANIVPEVTQRCASRYRSKDSLTTMLLETGFSKVDCHNILGHNWAQNYLDPEGPLKQEWRNVDSYWALFTDDELRTAIKRVEDMRSAGTLNQFMLDNDTSTKKGHIVLVEAKKQ